MKRFVIAGVLVLVTLSSSWGDATEQKAAGIMLFVRAPLHLTVVSGSGRKCGFDTSTNSKVSEIEKCGYDDAGLGGENPTRALELADVAAGRYEIFVSGKAANSSLRLKYYSNPDQFKLKEIKVPACASQKAKLMLDVPIQDMSRLRLRCEK